MGDYLPNDERDFDRLCREFIYWANQLDHARHPGDSPGAVLELGGIAYRLYREAKDGNVRDENGNFHHLGGYTVTKSLE